MKKYKRLPLFLLGGAGYVGLELLWRGRSHSSMFLAGGTCFLLLGKLGRTKLPPVVQGLAGAGVITAVELLTGIAVNRDFGVWDYRTMPFQLGGQICLPYSLLWYPVSLGAIQLYTLAERFLYKSIYQSAGRGAWAADCGLRTER